MTSGGLESEYHRSTLDLRASTNVFLTFNGVHRERITLEDTKFERDTWCSPVWNEDGGC